jgi:hypothetical protein
VAHRRGLQQQASVCPTNYYLDSNIVVIHHYITPTINSNTIIIIIRNKGKDNGISTSILRGS